MRYLVPIPELASAHFCILQVIQREVLGTVIRRMIHIASAHADVGDFCDHTGTLGREYDVRRLGCMTCNGRVVGSVVLCDTIRVATVERGARHVLIVGDIRHIAPRPVNGVRIFNIGRLWLWYDAHGQRILLCNIISRSRYIL
jgi:hypothetical protein